MPQPTSNNHLQVVDAASDTCAVLGGGGGREDVVVSVADSCGAAVSSVHRRHRGAVLQRPGTSCDDQVPAEGSRRTVRAGDDVVLECEAAGRPSPTVYWQHDRRLHVNPVHTVARMTPTVNQPSKRSPRYMPSSAALALYCARWLWCSADVLVLGLGKLTATELCASCEQKNHHRSYSSLISGTIHTYSSRN